jgi:putative spermidine/putrescine transport system permease protein
VSASTPDIAAELAIVTELAGTGGLGGAEIAQGAPQRPSNGGRALQQFARHALSLAPFSVYVTVFLFVPAVAIAVGAFQNNAGHFTWENLRLTLSASQPYRQGFINSIEISLLSSVIPGFVGLLIAYAVHTGKPTSMLRRIVISLSGVFANFGGVPLAFLFGASLGPAGLGTVYLLHLGIHMNSTFLYSFTGVVFVYMFFQIPLMVLIILPALEGLRPAWRDAARNLGARSWQYWRYVGAPVLLPSFLGSLLLLFGFGLAAYATAYALTSGSIALTPIQIGSFLNGNVYAAAPNVGKMLGLGMLVILAIAMTGYIFLQRRASKWLR